MDINFSGEGPSPLIFAAREGHADIVNYLINDLGADPNLCLEGHNSSPLSFASYYGHLKVCEILIAAGADLNEVRDRVQITLQ